MCKSKELGTVSELRADRLGPKIHLSGRLSQTQAKAAGRDDASNLNHVPFLSSDG